MSAHKAKNLQLLKATNPVCAPPSQQATPPSREKTATIKALPR